MGSPAPRLGETARSGGGGDMPAPGTPPDLGHAVGHPQMDAAPWAVDATSPLGLSPVMAQLSPGGLSDGGAGRWPLGLIPRPTGGPLPSMRARREIKTPLPRTAFLTPCWQRGAPSLDPLSLRPEHLWSRVLPSTMHREARLLRSLHHPHRRLWMSWRQLPRARLPGPRTRHPRARLWMGNRFTAPVSIQSGCVR